MKEGLRRIHFLDEIRGFAIICMVIHHMFYDIGFVLGLPWGYEVFDFLCIFQPIFWGAFIITSGICSCLSRNPVRRGFIVLAGGIAVTIVTAVIMPMMNITGAEIYFGILSCLGLCMIITGIFMPIIEKINDKAGILVCALLFSATYNISSKKLLFGLVTLPDFLYKYNVFCIFGFYNDSFFSADYFPLIPWLFLFLIGAFFGRYAKSEKLPEWAYKSRFSFLQAAGKNSLWIYLAHQVVLYGIMYLIKLFF